MHRRALAAVVLAACGHAAAPSAPIANGRPPPVEEAAALELPDDPAVRDQQIAILRDLVADSTGADAADAQARLFELLDTHPDRSRRPEGIAVAAALIASPDFAALATADQVLYAYGAALHAAARDDDARAIWTRLVQDYPTSALVPDVYAGLGDRAFDDADLLTAEKFYDQALRFPKANVALYARYKRAWVHYNLSRYEDAMEGFLEVARAGKDPLRKEALQDLVRTYAEAGAPGKALAFFQHVDRDGAAELTLRLGETYNEMGKADDAAIAFRAAMPGLGDDACRAALGLIEAEHLRLSSHADLLRGFEALAAGPRPGDCADRAEELVTGAARAWTVEQRRLKADPADAIAAWALAEQVATSAAGRRAAAHAGADLLWQRAAFAGDAAAWADTAEAFHHAGALGDLGADGLAIDAWTNGLRLSRSIGARARAALAPIAAQSGPDQVRARTLLGQI